MESKKEELEKFNPKEGRDCFCCAYKKDKSGTAHKACNRNFPFGIFLSGTLINKETNKSEDISIYIDPVATKITGEKVVCVLSSNQWTRSFPVDFDPIWVRACLGWSKEIDKRLVRRYDPLTEMLGIMGSAGRI